MGHARERDGKQPMNSWMLGLRQVKLVIALNRRAKGENPYPDDESTIAEAEKLPAFYGLKKAPPTDLTGQELIAAFNEDEQPMYEVARGPRLT